MHVIIGLAFGDEGKGATTDYLVRETGAACVIRYNGGPQAAHHVVAPDGRSHVFAQFGSGTFVPGTRTFLSRGMCVDPPALLREESVLREKGITDALDRLEMDEHCLVVTPYHGAVNRMREIARGDHPHGSCGRGVGQAVLDAEMEDAPAARMADCRDLNQITQRVRELRSHYRNAAREILDAAEQARSERLREELDYLEDLDEIALARDYFEFARRVSFRDAQGDIPAGDLVLEGAQGVLLDRDYGFFPHVTPSRCVGAGAARIAADYLRGETFQLRRYGILRAYGVRHGAGPFPAEDAGWNPTPDEFNRRDPWQGSFRVGWQDLVLARYALNAVEHANQGEGIDEIVVTNLDRARHSSVLRLCIAYEFPEDDAEALELFHWEQTKDGNIIRDIRVPTHPGPEHGARLTKALRKCRPIYHDFMAAQDETPPGELSERDRSFLTFLQANLNKPVTIASLGPAARHRIRLNL